jgi:DNA-binding MarR family transcriptional regulator
MHYATFPFKRMHYATLRLLVPIAARHDLTPARFDILHALILKPIGPRILPYQIRIAKALGICRSTICKMVKALEKAGFIKRTVELWDQRCRRLELTPYGRRCLLRVLKALRSREVDRALRASLVPSLGRSYARRSAFIHRLVHTVHRLNMALNRDVALNFFPIPPPDFPWNTKI